MTGTCKPDKEGQKTSDPLALEQFLSAFLMLMFGILVAALLLLMEYLYFKYVRHHLAKSDKGGCFALLSRVNYKKYSRTHSFVEFDVFSFKINVQKISYFCYLR